MNSGSKLYAVNSIMSGEWTFSNSDCKVVIKQGMANQVTISDNRQQVLSVTKQVTGHPPHPKFVSC